MEPAKSIFEVKDLHKTFHVGFFRKRIDAVRGVSFDVHEGEIFGLLGPNGAGKTTLIKTAIGLLYPTKGEIRIMGVDSKQSAARKDIGYLPENPFFHEYLTPRELLEFYGRLHDMSRSEIKSQRDRLIDLVGLTEAAKRPLRKLSKGMLQRIGIAQALLGNPKLLILDEPMSGLDPIGRKFAADLITDLNAKGVTVIFSSHILSDVEHLCHRVAILNKGRKTTEGRLSELLKGETGTQTLESLFVKNAFDAEPKSETNPEAQPQS